MERQCAWMTEMVYCIWSQLCLKKLRIQAKNIHHTGQSQHRIMTIANIYSRKKNLRKTQKDWKIEFYKETFVQFMLFWNHGLYVLSFEIESSGEKIT